MIADFDRHHGVVLRQLLVGHGDRMRIGAIEMSGRAEAFSVEDAAIFVKHSSKRLSPWHFTYTSENLADLMNLRGRYSPVWGFLVCGQDGILGLSLDELTSITAIGEAGAAWVRVSRNRKSMYRVSGSLGELPRAKSRGVQAFLTELFPPSVMAAA